MALVTRQQRRAFNRKVAKQWVGENAKENNAKERKQFARLLTGRLNRELAWRLNARHIESSGAPEQPQAQEMGQEAHGQAAGEFTGLERAATDAR